MDDLIARVQALREIVALSQSQAQQLEHDVENGAAQRSGAHLELNAAFRLLRRAVASLDDAAIALTAAAPVALPVAAE